MKFTRELSEVLYITSFFDTIFKIAIIYWEKTKSSQNMVIPNGMSEDKKKD